MILQLCEKQREMQAKKRYKENIIKIIDLDDVCYRIDAVKSKISNIDYDFKNRHIKELSFIQNEMIEQIRDYEEENIGGGNKKLWMKMKSFGRKLIWHMKSMFQDN